MVLESNTLDVLFVKDGQQGEDGKILYTWIKYAKDASGTGITDDPNGAIYIGISYNNESSIESNDPTHYAWTKIQGADGKKGEDAYTIFLENENISFATDKNRNPLSEQAYTSGITIMKGAKPVTDFTIGDIAKTQGIAVAKTDTAIAISVVNGNPLPNDNGEIEIPITVGGTVFKKILTWTCAKKGDQGEKGENGQDGISPKVSLLKSGDTTTISIVDATGTHTQTVKDGTNGTPGAAGKDGKTSYFHVKYSNDGGKTFTGNSGEDTGTYMGSYTDYTEADSTDVKKYNWVKVKGDKGDKGDTGQKGQDGTSVKITSKSVTYQTSTSGTIAPTGTWVTTVPTINNGQYLWTKTTVQYSDGNKTEAYSVSYKGTNGTNGTSVTVSKTEVTYQVSTSGTTAPTGTWSTTMPSCDQGQYLWTKTYVKYSDGKDTTSYSVSYKGVDGEKFAFNMLRETNQGRKHWVNMGASGKYSVESITTEDSINAVKLICTEPIASNEWQFCEFSDYEMLKSLKASTAYTLSYDIKTNRSGKISHNIKTGGGQKPFFANDISCKVLGNETWEHVSLKMTSGTTLPNLDRQVIYMFDNALSKVGYSIIKNLKLTEGIVDTPWAPHPEDLEGRGVSETVQYYLATSQASGVTSSTSGWSTDITTQKLTADKKYLWNCYQTKYSDGTSEPISTPKVIGVYGDKGNGIVASVQRPNKTEFWWSQVGAVGHKDTFDDSSNTRNNCRVGDIFTVMGTSTEGNSHTVYYKSATDSGDLAGECINHVIAESGTDAKNLSITPSSQYFKSTDGGKTFAPNTITIKPTIQGEINFGKWQYSIDGGVSFADVVSGQKGLTISNNVLTVSKDSGLYSDAVTMVTFRAVASDSSFYDTCSIAKIYDVSDIGDGRNLWITRDNITLQACEKDKYIYTTTGTSAVCIGADVSSVGTNTIALQTGTKYTISFVISSPSEVSNARWFFCTALNNTGAKNYGGYGVKLVTGENIVSQTITVDTSCDAAGLVIYNLPTDCIIKDIQVEKGSSPTGWTPAPEDIQTAILSTKSEISDVSSQVDKNKQAIEQRVEKTTYQQDLTLVKGDISKANEGLNKWRYEIYPKSLFTDKPEDQRKISLDVFARNKNIIPTQSILLDDTKLGQSNYDDNYIGYAVTFVKMSEATKLETTFVYDDAGSFYLNGKLICTNGTNNFYSSATPDTVSCTLVKGWNCLEVIINEGAGSEGFKFGTVLSQLSTCQLMNCYYAMVTGRESRITNTLVQNTIDIEGVSTKVGKVTSIIGEDGKNFTDFKNEYSDFKQTMNEFEATVGQTYVTKDDFNGLEIGGRNLLTKDDCNMSKWKNLYPAHCKVTNNDYSNHIDYVPTGGEWEIIYKKISVTKGQKYILSFDYKVNKAYNYLSGQKYGVYLSTSIPTNAAPTNIITDGQYVIENTVTSLKRGVITFTAPIDTLYIVINGGCIDDNQTGLSFEFNKWKLEKGNKITDWTPAPEDDEINGQNLVSNLPSNWEQGTVTEGSTTGTTYANTKSSSAGSVRPKELIPVSGNITISTAYSNQSKKPIRHWIAAYDVNKNYLGNNYVSNAWNSFPRTLNMKDAKYIAIMVGYTDSSAITPSDISQICLKIERGTSATPFTLAPEDVNGKIVNVETIANQTAKKFEWIVKGGDSSSNFTLTDRVADLVAEKINFKGLVKFSGLAKSTQDKINSPTSGNLITVSPTNPTSNYGNTTFSIVSDDAGGRCIQTTAQFVPFTNYASNIFKPGEQIYYNINVPNWSSTTFDANLGIWFFTAEKKCVANSCTRVTLQRTIWNRLSGYITVPTSGWSGIIYYVIGIENPNKYQLGLVSNSYIEKTTSYATTYASSAVNWVTSNGSSTTSLNSMVKKWTDGAVSDTAQINGGWIKANTITASKIAVGDFTNYADICESNTHGFTVEKTADGVWFSKDGSKLARDNYISKMYSCEPGQTFYVEYDISNTIKDSTEYKAAGIMLLGCDGTQAVKWYQRRGAVVGTAAGTVTHMSQQLTMPSGTRFFYVVLQIEGHPPFTGTLKIRNLSVRKAVTGAVIVDGSITADKIATDAIKSRNYISSGGTQGSFLNLSDGSFTSPNLSWDSNGNLIAKNANLSGEITAINGTIGKYEITDQWLTTGSGSTCTGMGGNQAFWAGGEDSNSAPFRVGYDGKLTSSNADITGTITATNGKIGRYDITSTYLMTNSGSNASGIGGNQAFWAGAEDSNSAPFRVGYDGVLWAENAAIRGSIETGNLGDEGDTVSIINGHIGIRGTSNNVEIYSTGFKFGIDGDYYLESVSEGVKCYRNLYATDFVADGWVYCSEVHSSGAVVIGADSESFYWAHGYQIGRGTSWGGVCLGDDSQQLRLYGSSIWASHSISTSDENLKENFTTLDQYEDFYMNLNPIGFNYIGDYDGKKTHFGFGAHKTEDILESEGYDADKFAVVTHRPLVQEDIEKRFGKDVEVDIETEYGVSYTEFIALNTHMIQKTRRELTKVKQEKANLEARLQVIEAKLGL